MALQTENGWYQIPASETVRAVVPGTKNVRLEIQKGIPATILNAWAAWYHKNVEDIEYNYNNGSRDDWAWSATNDVWNSNHLSGTAIDLNATKYPWGTYRMPKHQVDKVNEGLRLFEGTVFWGRNWSKPDEMHFQIAFPPGDARLAKFAEKLNNGHLGIYGSPKPKETAIQAKRRVTPWLGDKNQEKDELPTPDGKGAYCYYNNGAIYWTAITGACALSPEMVEKYRSLDYEAGFLKYPTSDVFDLKDGHRCQRFQGGSLYYNKNLNQVFSVFGRIGAEWASWNWENGHLGMPVEEVQYFAGGASQKFTNGKIYWSNKTDAHAVYGAILVKFEDGGVPKYGFPLKAEGDAQDMKGRYQNFEFATIYYKWGTDHSYAVSNQILRVYKLMGFEVGRLGFPTSDEVETANGKRQEFERGAIEVDFKQDKTIIEIDGTKIDV